MNKIKSFVVWIATLLPWWANLMLAEVSFSFFHMLYAKSIAMIAVPAMFFACSIIGTAIEAEREEELRRKIKMEGPGAYPKTGRKRE